MHNRLTILLADGDAAQRGTLERLLTDLGHCVVAVDGGGPLLRECRASRPDLIISDTRLPDADGIAAAAAAGRPGLTPVILMDAEWTPDHARRAAAAGVGRRLAKPVLPLALVSAIRGVRQRQARMSRGPADPAAFVAHLDGVAVATLDAGGRVTAWNRGAEALFGVPAAKAVGAAWADLSGGEDEWPPAGPTHLDRWLPHADGGGRWATGRVTPLPGGGYGVALTDRTAEKAEIDRARAELDALRRTDADRAVQIAVLAHELRNQISPLLNYAHLIAVRTDQPDVREFAAKADRNVRQMMGLIDDIMDSVRNRRGTLTLNRGRADMRDVVAAAVEQARPAAEGRRHTLAVAVDGPAWVDGDADRLGRAVVNLLVNAAKFTPNGGRIDVGVATADGHAVVRVRDSGVGIPENRLESVFKVFDQDPRTVALSQGGLGLGLPLVRDVVALHGGTVEAFSGGDGAGSEFVMRVPLCDVMTNVR